MPMPSPTDVANKWASNLGAAQQAYTQGVQRVQQSPMAAAAQNAQGYLNGVQAAVNSGKWQNGLNRVTLQQWQQQAVNVGAARLATGANAAKPKMQAFLTAFLPQLEQNVNQVRQMPAATFNDRMQRMIQMATLNHQFVRP